MCCHLHFAKVWANPLAPSPPVPNVLAASVNTSAWYIGLLSASSVTKIGLAAGLPKIQIQREFQVFWWWFTFLLGKKTHHSCKFHHLSVCSIHWRAGQVTVVLCHFQGPHFSSQSFKTRQTWPNKKRWHVDMRVGNANWDAFDAILAAYHLPWWPVGSMLFNKTELPGTGEAKACQIYPNLKELISRVVHDLVPVISHKLLYQRCLLTHGLSSWLKQVPICTQ